MSINTIPKEVLNYILKHEGGFSNNAVDKGGPTNFGITLNTYTKYNKIILKQDKQILLEDIKNIPISLVADIYTNFYYIPSKANKIFNLNFKNLATKYLDICVNAGQGRGFKLLQQTFNLNSNNKIIDIINLLEQQKQVGLEKSFESNILDALCNNLCDFYNNIVIKNPSQKIFLKGWIKRALEKPNL